MRKHGEIPVNSRLEVKFPSIRDVNVDRLTEHEPELVFKSSRNLLYGTIQIFFTQPFHAVSY